MLLDRPTTGDVETTRTAVTKQQSGKQVAEGMLTGLRRVLSRLLFDYTNYNKTDSCNRPRVRWRVMRAIL